MAVLHMIQPAIKRVVTRTDTIAGSPVRTLSSPKTRKRCRCRTKRLATFFVALLQLVLLSIVEGAILSSLEWPYEEEVIAEKKATAAFIKVEVLGHRFGFYRAPDTSGGCSTCSACFPQADASSPRLEEDAADMYFTAAGVECSDGTAAGCRLTCALQLPTCAQVEACIVGGGSHDLTTLSYDPACLVNSEDCPNCDVLGGNLTVGGSGSLPLTKAALYPHYGAAVEESIAEKRINWDYSGSIFFIFTVMSTIGYGNFAPSTDGSKILITLTAIPIIVIFGYSVAKIGDVVFDTLICCYKVKPSFESRVEKSKVYVKMLNKYDINGDGHLSQSELVQASSDLNEAVGGRGRTKEELEKEIFELFQVCDDDGSGMLSKEEAFGLFNLVCQRRDAEKRKRAAYAHVLVLFGYSLGVIIVGSIFFYIFEEDFTFVDALYFSVVTLTTVGLGDLTPSRGYFSMTLWYVYVLLGLGILTLSVRTLTDMSAAMVALDELQVKKPRKDKDVGRVHPLYDELHDEEESGKSSNGNDIYIPTPRRGTTEQDSPTENGRPPNSIKVDGGYLPA